MDITVNEPAHISANVPISARAIILAARHRMTVLGLRQRRYREQAADLESRQTLWYTTRPERAPTISTSDLAGCVEHQPPISPVSPIHFPDISRIFHLPCHPSGMFLTISRTVLGSFHSPCPTTRLQGAAFYNSKYSPTSRLPAS